MSSSSEFFHGFYKSLGINSIFSFSILKAGIKYLIFIGYFFQCVYFYVRNDLWSVEIQNIEFIYLIDQPTRVKIHVRKRF